LSSSARDGKDGQVLKPEKMGNSSFNAMRASHQKYYVLCSLKNLFDNFVTTPEKHFPHDVAPLTNPKSYSLFKEYTTVCKYQINICNKIAVSTVIT